MHKMWLLGLAIGAILAAGVQARGDEAPLSPEVAIEEARNILEWAADGALETTEPQGRSPRLHDIARELRRFDPEEAVKVAQLIDTRLHGHTRKLALREIFEEWTNTDPDVALTKAEGLQTEDERQAALYGVAAALARTEWERALALTDPLPKSQDWWDAIRRLIMVMRESDPDAALRFAESVEDPLVGLRSVACVAVKLAEEKPVKALAAYHRARAFADDAGVPGTEVVCRAAQVFAAVSLDRALTFARSFDEVEAREKALAYTALWLDERDPERAIEIAREIQKPLRRSAVLEFIAPHLAKKDLDKAVAIMHELDEGGHTDVYRPLGVGGVMEELLKIDLERAFEEGRKLRLESVRSWAFAKIAVELARRDVQAGSIMMRMVIDRAKAIPDERDRLWTLNLIAPYVAKVDTSAALRIFAEEGLHHSAMGRLRKTIRELAQQDGEQCLMLVSVARHHAEEADKPRMGVEILTSVAAGLLDWALEAPGCP